MSMTPSVGGDPDLVALGIEEDLGDLGEAASVPQGGDRLVVVPFPQSDTAVSTASQV